MTHARVLLIDSACIEKGRGVLIPCPRVLLTDGGPSHITIPLADDINAAGAEEILEGLIIDPLIHT